VGEDKVISADVGTGEYITLYNDDKKTDSKRDFMKEILCQILSINPDVRAGTVTIDVRLAKYSNAWGER